MPETDRYSKVKVDPQPEPMPRAKINASPELQRPAPFGSVWWRDDHTAHVSFWPSIAYALTLDLGVPILRRGEVAGKALALGNIADMLVYWAGFEPLALVMFEDPSKPDLRGVFSALPAVCPNTRDWIVGRCWCIAYTSNHRTVRRGKVLRELFYRPRHVV